MYFVKTIVLVLLASSINFNIFVSTETSDSERASKEEKYRLPTSIIPLAYNINIVPFLDNDNFTFNGDVWIRFSVVEETSVVSLHYNDIDEITSDSIQIFHLNNSITPPNVLYINYSRDIHICDVNMESKLTAGNEYTIRIKYKGYIRDDLHGLYRSSYVTNTGETRWIAATHLSPISARRVFPCFDEPEMKATFNISVARTAERKVVSNMPVASVSDPDPDLDGMVWDHFQETDVPISPHMVAIFITDFTTVSKDIVTVWERADVASQADYSASVSSTIIEVLENFTGYKYMLSKMDEVAVPDHHTESEGQLGLIAHRENFLLFDNNESTSLDKQNIAMTLTQETSEMWFGNLISLKWWDYLWLNEGFSTYFKYFALTEIEKGWHMDEQFIVKNLHKALAVDSVNTSRPLTTNVTDFNEIMSVFDDISYLKAASIIRMMKHIVTVNTFQKGVNRYLQSVGNKSAEPNDLYSALHAQYIEDVNVSNFDLRTIMDTWTLQMGYPVLTVTRDYNSSVITVEQERFFLEEAVNGTDTNDYKWWIPLTYTTESIMDFENTETKDWLKAEDTKRDLMSIHVSNDEWIIFNIQQTGFYRVNYDDVNWKHIAKFLNSDRFHCIPPINRAQLLDDIFNLARPGHMNYSVALEVINYLERETDYIPWYAALSGLTYIDQHLRGASDDDYQIFKDFVLNLIDKVYNSLLFEQKDDDDHMTKLNRNQIMTLACKLGKYDCISKSVAAMARVIEDNAKKVSPDMKSVIYCNGIKYGGMKVWEYLWNRFNDISTMSSERVLILEALGCSRNESLVHRYMSLSLNDSSGIRSQDKSLVFPSVYKSHDDGVDFTINFLLNNYREIKEYHNNIDAVVSLIKSLSEVLFKESQINKLKEFLNENRSYLGDTATEASLNALQTAQKNIDWFNTNHKSIIKFSRDHIYRLPESCIPVMYTLKLYPYLADKNFTFSGEIEIVINATEPTNRIVLNAHDLDINSSAIVVISLTTGLDVPVLYTISDNENERYTIKLKNDLTVGHKYEVSMLFNGHLRNDFVGFYKSSYSVGKDIRWLGATQFETSFARYAFPCFDEPALKATFRVNIARDSDYNVIFNTPLESSDIISTGTGERVLDTFEETPVMSTYLIAFIISDFYKSTSGSTSTWQRKGASSQAKYSLTISQPIVSTLEAFLEVGYELPKLDQVAVPDLSTTAMENWGLLTYTESSLLIDDVLSSEADKQSVALLIAHEISHEWFGNLVTLKWWSYLWLNEGFATYFQYYALAEVETAWHLEHQFIVDCVQKAFLQDSYRESRAMTFKVDKPSLVLPSIFDIIIYEKAGSVIRMISHSISAETFKKGLNKYLKNLSHSSADTNSLERSLRLQLQEESKDVDIMAILDSWSTQMGYPVITVNRNYDSGNITVTQERFTLNNKETAPCGNDYKWWIPLTYTSKLNSDFNNTESKLWMNTNKLEVMNITAESDEWVIFNIQEAGYYRVNYDVQNWKLIIDHLHTDNFTDIHVLNRAQLLDDAMNLARAGMLDYYVALELTKYLSNEMEYVPWKSALTAFSFIDVMMKSSDSSEMFKNYTVELVSNIYESLGIEGQTGDDHVTKLLRLEVLDWMCKAEVSDCVSNTTEMFSQFMSDPQNYRISADIAPVVYCTALATGGENEWNFLYDRYENSNVETEKVTILNSLGCSRSKDILKRYLDIIMAENSNIKSHLKPTALSSIYNNPLGTDIVMNFMTENYDILSKFYAIGNSVDKVIIGVAQMSAKQEQIEKMKNFLSNENLSVCDTLLSCKQALSILEHNSQWILSRLPRVEEWLNETDSLTSESDSVNKYFTSWVAILICTACLLILWG